MRLRTRLPLQSAVTSLVFAGIVALVAALVLRGVLLDRLEDDMSLQAHQFAAVLSDEALGLSSLPPAEVQVLTDRAGDAAGLRLTLIGRDGTVIADSEADPALLENHGDRPEVKQALAGREGRSRRESATLEQLEVYVAIPLAAGDVPWSEGVLRAAQPAGRIDNLVAESWRVPLIVWAIVLLPGLVVALFLARSITSPLARLQEMTKRVASGDLAFRTSVRRKDEIGELAEALNAMAGELESRAEQLRVEEETSGQVLSAMSDGVVVVDGGGRLVRANAAAGRILGATLEGCEGTPLVHVARSFPDRALVAKAEQAGTPLTEVLELPGQRYLAVEVIPLQQAGAEQAHTLFVIRDETVRLSTEQMRRDFVTNVSHELKTPLAGLSLLAETLKHAVREDPAQADVFLERFAGEVKRLNELTKDLLTLSRLEDDSSGAQAGSDAVDLGRLAEEIAAEMRPQADAKQLSLTVNAAPARVVGDEVALRTLIRNLLDNAIRYTGRAGRIAVTVGVETGSDGRTWAALAVEDNGIGIPLPEQRRIFERFYRVDKARSREAGGTGLGLSIVRHVAERHGGRVEVSSTLGSGSTFTVRIPAVPPESLPAEAV